MPDISSPSATTIIGTSPRTHHAESSPSSRTSPKRGITTNNNLRLHSQDLGVTSTLTSYPSAQEDVDMDNRPSSSSGVKSGNGSIGGKGENNEGGGGGEKSKKRKKKGWKGWALVLEDEDGNVIEVRDRGNTPPPGDGVSPLPSRGSMAAISDGVIGRNKQKSSSPLPPKTTSGPSNGTTSASTPAPPVSSCSTPKPSETKLPNDPSANKKRRKNSPVTASSTPQPEPNNPAPIKPTHSAQPSTHKPQATTTITKPKSARHSLPPSVPTRVGTAAAREEARQAQVSSRLGTPTAPAVTTPTAVVTDDNPLPKVPRIGMGEVYARPPESDIRAEALYIIDAAKRKREEERIRHLREESPGGEQQGLTPPPTAQSTTSSKLPLALNGSHTATHTNGTSGHEVAATTGYKGTLGVTYNTPVTAPHDRSIEHVFADIPPRRSHQASQKYPAGPSSPPSTASGSRRQSAISAPPHELPEDPNDQSDFVQQAQYPEDEFEAQFLAIQDSYRNSSHSAAAAMAVKAALNTESIISPQQLALGRGPNDPPPPRFHDGQKPTVVLTPGGNKLRSRDRFDRAHQEGFDGLPPDMQTDCDGFLENVRDNLKSIVIYFFRTASPRREAFLERIGRGLIELGWQLTDNGDLVLNLQEAPPSVPPQTTQPQQHFGQNGSTPGRR